MTRNIQREVSPGWSLTFGVERKSLRNRGGPSLCNIPLHLCCHVEVDYGPTVLSQFIFVMLFA